MHRAPDVVVDVAAQADGAARRSRSCRPAARWTRPRARHRCRGRPMAMPTCAAISAGASLTPSPVMATISPSRLSAFTRRSLCSGCTRAKTLVVADALPASRRPAHRCRDPAARRRPSPVRPGSDGAGGFKMVAGQHDDAHTGGACFGDRLGHAGPQRIGKSDQPEPPNANPCNDGHPAVHPHPASRCGDAEHAQATTRHRIDVRHETAARASGREAAQIGDGFRCALARRDARHRPPRPDVGHRRAFG